MIKHNIDKQVRALAVISAGLVMLPSGVIVSASNPTEEVKNLTRDESDSVKKLTNNNEQGEKNNEAVDNRIIITTEEELIDALTTRTPNKDGYLIKNDVALNTGEFVTPRGIERIIEVSPSAAIKIEGEVVINGNNALVISAEKDKNHQRHLGGSLVQISSPYPVFFEKIIFDQQTLSSMTGSSAISTTSKVTKNTDISIRDSEFIGSGILSTESNFSSAFDFNGELGNIEIKNNTIKNMTTPSYISNDSNDSINIISSNEIIDSFYGISFKTSKNSASATYQIDSNRFENIGSIKNSEGYAIDIHGNNRNFRIVSNTFKKSNGNKFNWIKDSRDLKLDTGILDVNSNIVDGGIFTSYNAVSNDLRSKIYLNTFLNKSYLYDDVFIDTEVGITNENSILVAEIKDIKIGKEIDENTLEGRFVLLENGLTKDYIEVSEVIVGSKVEFHNIDENQKYEVVFETKAGIRDSIYKQIFVSDKVSIVDENQGNSQSFDEDFKLESISVEETTADFVFNVNNKDKFKYPLLFQIIEENSGRKIETIISQVHIKDNKIIKNMGSLERGTNYTYVIKEAYGDKEIFKGEFKTKNLPIAEEENYVDYLITSYDIERSIIEDTYVSFKPHSSLEEKLEGGSNFVASVDNLEVEFIDGFIEVTGVVPKKTYTDFTVRFTDKFGKERNIKFGDFTTKEGSTKLKGFIRNTYFNALGRDPEEEGFYYWVDQIETGKITPENFVRNLLNEKEFLDKRHTPKDIIEGLYSVIVNRKAEKEGLEFWIGEYEKNILDGYDDEESIYILVNRMVNEEEFKILSEELKNNY